MYKNINTLDNWILVDSSRTNSNVVGAVLFPNLSNAEVSAGIIDFVSNGFKIRSAAGGDNGSGNTIIFAAFAETAFKFSLGR